MKKWTTPVVEEINFSETQYGGTVTSTFDNIFVNAEGSYEATFVQS